MQPRSLKTSSPCARVNISADQSVPIIDRTSFERELVRAGVLHSKEVQTQDPPSHNVKQNFFFAPDFSRNEITNGLQRVKLVEGSNYIREYVKPKLSYIESNCNNKFARE